MKLLYEIIEQKFAALDSVPESVNNAFEPFMITPLQIILMQVYDLEKS